ncbi:hypothetical protein NIES22_48440 [Calothrix brevissima NIES-22]|nr:hypothetical protein NIES22_48440 [Calothrix brevissima NIES-22]
MAGGRREELFRQLYFPLHSSVFLHRSTYIPVRALNSTLLPTLGIPTNAIGGLVETSALKNCCFLPKNGIPRDLPPQDFPCDLH